MDLKWVPFIPDVDANLDSHDVWGFEPEIVHQGHGVPLLSGRRAVVYPDTYGVSNGTELIKESPMIVTAKEVMMSELWWVFQWVDMAIDAAIQRVDRELKVAGLATEDSAGYVAMQVFLIIAPVLAIVYYFAIGALSSSNRKGFDNAKEI
jgi:hypothetical protein